MKENNCQIDVLDLKANSGAGQEMLLSANKFKALVENNDAIIALVDKNLNSIFRSSSSTRITGWEHDEFAKIAATDYIHPDDNEQVQLVMAEAIAFPGKTIPLTVRVLHKAGHYLWLQGSVTNMLHDEEIQGIITNMRDITKIKEAEEKSEKALRLYYFISQINQMIVRTTDESTLFKEVCTIGVEQGKFRMAWIGIINEQTRQVIPVMHAGEERGYLSEIKKISIADIPSGRGPTGTALREGRYIICNDIENEPSMLPWKEEALNRNYLSSMCLPIKKFGKVIGAFSLYAEAKNFFKEDEIALLEKATGDIAFALENFERENMRKKAEDAVIESERRYQTLAEISPVGIFHTDETGYTTYVNPRWCQISGLKKEEALGNGWFNAVHEADREMLSQDWNKATKASEISRSEYRFVRPDSSTRWVIGEAIPEKDAQGRIMGYVGTITDITERKLIEEEIANNEKRFKALIQNSTDGLTVIGTDGIIQDMSPSGYQILGYDKAEIIGKVRPDLIHPDDRDLVMGAFKQVIKDPLKIKLIEYRHKMPDGNYKWLECSFNNLLSEPFLNAIVLNYRDITDRLTAQEKIRETTEQLRMLTAHLQHIREEERKRIGREIHDELGQQLTAIKMDVAWLDKKMSEDQTVFKSKLKNIIELLDGSNQSIRRILSELRPSLLDDNGLPEALEWLGIQFTSNTAIPLHFTTSERTFRSSAAVITCIFRVYQEALTNITRYAQATKVVSSLHIVDGIICVQIEDNGKGFTPGSVQTHKSFGLLGMKERVLSLGGTFELYSSAGNGTKIAIKLPAIIPDKT